MKWERGRFYIDQDDEPKPPLPSVAVTASFVAAQSAYAQDLALLIGYLQGRALKSEGPGG